MYKTALASALMLLTAAQATLTPDRPLAATKTPGQTSAGLSREERTVVGNVAVRRAGNGNVVVIVDAAGGERMPDGVPDVVYRFAPLGEEADRHGEIAFNPKRAQVFFQSGRLAVLTKDNRVAVSLAVEQTGTDDAKSAAYGDTSRDLPNAVRFDRGVGLVRQPTNLSAESLAAAGLERASKISKLPALVDLEKSIVVRRGARALDEDIGIEGGRCASGGRGATECSINCSGGNGCSVICGVGYWACCNCPNNCQCQEKTE